VIHGPRPGMSGQRFCVSGGWCSTEEAEHGYWAVRDLVGCGYPYVCTTFEGPERVVVSGADDLWDLPDQARLFLFPGKPNLRGTVTVGDLVLVSAIDEVRRLAGGGDPRPDELVETRDFIRPRLQDHRLVLTVCPGERSLVPFEQPAPARCCSDH
jgi:hypothetical protein